MAGALPSDEAADSQVALARGRTWCSFEHVVLGGLALRALVARVFPDGLLPDSTSLRPFAPCPLQALHRYYERSDSCLVGSSAEA